MDDIDKGILRELSKDARVPFMTIARKLGTSTKTVIRRYEEMKANGTIVHSSIRVNLRKIGYAGTAHLFMKVKPDRNSGDTVECLKTTPNIIVATRSFSTYEAYAILAFKDIEDLWQSVLKIRRLPSVLDLDVSFAMPGIESFPPKEAAFSTLT